VGYLALNKKNKNRAKEFMKKIKTPYYLIDESELLKNLKKMRRLREISGAKTLLALKCFSTWSVFTLMREYMDGTTSSSLFEARLGHEEFGGETHAFSVGYNKKELAEIAKFADKIIFNSVSQVKMFLREKIGKRKIPLGIRVNPGISYSHFDLADPARRYSRLGVTDKSSLAEIAGKISGIMFHFNCENDNFANFANSLDYIGKKYSDILKKMEWVSLGGGIAFTKKDYPFEKFCAKLKDFARKYQLQIYLEPGEASITESTELVSTVLDIVHNEIDTAIIDASTEAHMLDLLIYRQNAKIANPKPGPYPIMIAGRSCLAGDIFGKYSLNKKLKQGDEIRIADAAGYTMVKKNWFNGLQMPAIVVHKLNGKIKVIREFSYLDFKKSLS
jgi:carboxynorspermidine decarboxylase